MIASFWMILEKAGEPGWKSLVPFYGGVVMLRILGRPWWWLVLLAIPFVNIVPSVKLCVDLAHAFGKGKGYVAGLMILTPLYLVLLAFGPAEYQGEHGRKKLMPEEEEEEFLRAA